ncbi:MAG: ATP synthase subunit I [Syntrophobacteria bacterium]
MKLDLPYLLLALIAGAGIGTVYFLGLWWTVQRLSRARHPFLLVIGSLAGRLSVTLLCFYLVTAGCWPSLLSCVLGFLMIRGLLVQHLKPEKTAWQHGGHSHGY